MPKLPHISEVEPRSEKDEACFDELRAVLERHGALSRFGITLLHQHFEIGDHEVQVETVDERRRIETARPKRRDDAAISSAIETSWRLDAPLGHRYCERYCQQPWGPSGPHTGGHATT